MRFQKGYPCPLSYPLTSIPELESRIVSPRIGNAHGVPAPSMPGDSGFEEIVYEIVKVRLFVEGNKWPFFFFEKYDLDPLIPKPLIDVGLRQNMPKGAAHIVHMDLPMELTEVLLRWVAGRKCELKTPPNHRSDDFLYRFPKFLSFAAKNIYDALEKSFEVKYFYGRPRPEEVTQIGAEFTHYPEGCPSHPEYVAGHGTMAGACYKSFVEYFHLTEEERQVVELSTKHFAMYRSLAGVHYADANLEGWNLGSR